MKILVADKFAETHLADLRTLGLEVDYRPGLGAANLAAALPGVTILVVRSTQVTREAIEAGEALALIIRAGAGVNTIDRAAASRRGVFVANCPGKNAVAVAELVFALLLGIDRRVPEQVTELRTGRWNKKEYGKADGLMGKTFGILGLGAIGGELVPRAKAFGMNVIAWEALSKTRCKSLGVEQVATPAELAARADIVSINLALVPDTKGLVNAAFLAAMKPGAILINAARAEIVDTEALAAAVRERGLRVGVDVHAGEPDGGTGQLASPLFALPAVYPTHHVGASTRQAENAIADETVRIVRTFLVGGEVPNCVNLCKKSPASWQLVVRHLDKVGVLANVLGALRRHQINVEEMDNQIFEGATAACCTLRLGSEPTAECLAEIRGRTDEVIHAGLVKLPAA